MNRVAGFTIALFIATCALAGCSAPAAPDLPTVAPPALGFDVGSRPDFGQNMVSCLSEKGWPVSPGTDGGYRIDALPPEQHDAYTSDQEACTSSNGYDQPPSALTDAQVRAVYEHMLWEVKCFSEKGYEPEVPLSEQAYVGEYHAHGSLWTPYSQFTSTLSEDDLEKLFDECPRAF